MRRIVYNDGDEALKKFHEELKNHKFMSTKCKQCNKLFFPPKATCPYCLSEDLEWQSLSGEGILYAFTQHDRSLIFGPPEVIGLVELKEGVGRILSKIEGKYEDLKIGMKLKIDFVDLSNEFTVHKFVPVEE